MGLLVPEARNGVATDVVWVGFEIELFEIGEAIEGFLFRTSIPTSEEPTILSELKVRQNELDDVL